MKSKLNLCPYNPPDCQLCSYNVGKGYKPEFAGLCLYGRGDHDCNNCGLSGLKQDDSYCLRCGFPADEIR